MAPYVTAAPSCSTRRIPPSVLHVLISAKPIRNTAEPSTVIGWERIGEGGPCRSRKREEEQEKKFEKRIY
jgi:hypothetical protein